MTENKIHDEQGGKAPFLQTQKWTVKLNTIRPQYVGFAVVSGCFNEDGDFVGRCVDERGYVHDLIIRFE